MCCRPVYTCARTGGLCGTLGQRGNGQRVGKYYGDAGAGSHHQSPELRAHWGNQVEVMEPDRLRSVVEWFYARILAC